MTGGGKNILAFGFNDPFVRPVIPMLAAAEGVGEVRWITNALGEEILPPTPRLTIIDMQEALNAVPERASAGMHGVVMTDALQRTYDAALPVVMKMMDRMEKHGPEQSYYQRKKRFHDLFHYWLAFLQRHRIDYFLCVDIPHEMTDYVIAELCRTLGVGTLSFTQMGIDAVIAVAHYTEVGTERQARMSELSAQRREDLHRVMTTRIAHARGEQTTPAKPFYANQAWMKTHDRNVKARQRGRLRAKLPGLLGKLTDPAAWNYLYYLLWYRPVVEKRRQQRYWRAYEKITDREVDFDRPYVYLPLHYQPEMTTSPLAERYNDQYLMAFTLLAAFPEDVHVYVKEYPRQRLPGRSLDYWEYFPQSDRIHFMPVSVDSGRLQEHAVATATATGTAGFEALWKSKPVLVFGNAYYQRAPGAFRIRTVSDARAAAKAILDGPAIHYDMPGFMRDMEGRVLPANLNAYWAGASYLGLSPEENSGLLLEEILARLRAV